MGFPHLSASEVISHDIIISHNHVCALDCRFCGATAALRSHRRNFLEFLRTRLTGKVPFRCNRCKRRSWFLIDPRDI